MLFVLELSDMKLTIPKERIKISIIENDPMRIVRIDIFFTVLTFFRLSNFIKGLNCSVKNKKIIVEKFLQKKFFQLLLKNIEIKWFL
jgi:hypothetical protein